MNDDHEHLVHLPAEEEEQQLEEDVEESTFDPTAPINQWKLLKKIQDSTNKTLALSDMCKMFEIEDRQSPRLWKPLNQLLRGGRIRQMIGSGTNGQIGTVLEVQKSVRERGSHQSET